MGNTENENRAAGAPSALNDELGEWNTIVLTNDEPHGDCEVLVARYDGSVGLADAATVRSLKRSAIKEGDECVFKYWMHKPKAPNIPGEALPISKGETKL